MQGPGRLPIGPVPALPGLNRAVIAQRAAAGRPSVAAVDTASACEVVGAFAEVAVEAAGGAGDVQRRIRQACLQERRGKAQGEGHESEADQAWARTDRAKNAFAARGVLAAARTHAAQGCARGRRPSSSGFTLIAIVGASSLDAPDLRMRWPAWSWRSLSAPIAKAFAEGQQMPGAESKRSAESRLVALPCISTS